VRFAKSVSSIVTALAFVKIPLKLPNIIARLRPKVTQLPLIGYNFIIKTANQSFKVTPQNFDTAASLLPKMILK
jgi:hypothetical protein